MSDILTEKPAEFSDPGEHPQALTVSREEYGELTEALQNRVMPLMGEVANVLEAAGFRITQLRCLCGAAGLRAETPGQRLQAWLSIAINCRRLTRERIFWLYAIKVNGVRSEGRAGRFPGLSDMPALGIITAEFMDLCAALTGKLWMGRSSHP